MKNIWTVTHDDEATGTIRENEYTGHDLTVIDGGLIFSDKAGTIRTAIPQGQWTHCTLTDQEHSR